mmetsp:Transcript_103964/g.324916  ORF Transcript_103964/g.324916 Transcript_103964/m.324916 type:complete len:134 (-) Transcript_103964:95-496(-)
MKLLILFTLMASSSAALNVRSIQNLKASDCIDEAKQQEYLYASDLCTLVKKIQKCDVEAASDMIPKLMYIQSNSKSKICQSSAADMMKQLKEIDFAESYKVDEANYNVEYITESWKAIGGKSCPSFLGWKCWE